MIMKCRRGAEVTSCAVFVPTVFISQNIFLDTQQKCRSEEFSSSRQHKDSEKVQPGQAGTLGGSGVCQFSQRCFKFK